MRCREEGIIMSDVSFELKIEGDSEGYITFECPFCESEFKLQAGEFQSDDNNFVELYCPYCGLTDEVTSFYSEEVMRQAQVIAYNYAIEELNKVFGNLAKNVSSSNCIKMKWKPLQKVNTKELKDKDTVEEVFGCPTCGNHEKVLYCAGVSKVYCAYCGGDI